MTTQTVNDLRNQLSAACEAERLRDTAYARHSTAGACRNSGCLGWKLSAKLVG